MTATITDLVTDKQVTTVSCSWVFLAGHRCAADAVEPGYDTFSMRPAGLLDAVPLCTKHAAEMTTLVIRNWTAQREALLQERRSASDWCQRLARAKPSYTKSGDRWRFELRLPQTKDFAHEGFPKKLRRSGFARKLDAQREVERIKTDLTDRMDLQRISARILELETVEQSARDAAREHLLERSRELAREAGIGRRERERARFVYYVERPDGAIKIGTTWNIDTRMQAFRNVSPVKLLAVHSGGQPAEAALHRRFRADRLDGEWFNASPELLAHIKHVIRRSDRSDFEKRFAS